MSKPPTTTPGQRVIVRLASSDPCFVTCNHSWLRVLSRREGQGCNRQALLRRTSVGVPGKAAAQIACKAIGSEMPFAVPPSFATKPACCNTESSSRILSVQLSVARVGTLSTGCVCVDASRSSIASPTPRRFGASIKPGPWVDSHVGNCSEIAGCFESGTAASDACRPNEAHELHCRTVGGRAACL